MNNVGEKYLPIGTVVMLQGGTKRVMITGFCSMAAEDKSVMYDYSGCMYPEGFLSSDQTALFNHDQIVQVYHMGLIDDEEKTFKQNLNTLITQMKGVAQNFEQPAAQPAAQPVAQSNGLSFDENGTVVAVSPEAKAEETAQEEVPVPPIGPGLPGYVAPAAPAATATTGGYTFDENGTVVSAPAPEAPAAPAATATTGGYTFDENGTVVSAPAPEAPAAPVVPSTIKFDKNGIVVSE